MASPYPNESRNERTGHKAGGKGKQGGHGTGQVKCSAEGGKGKSANFKPASQVIKEPIVGEHDVPGFGVVKGASSVPFGSLMKGKPGTPLHGGKVQKPQGAKDSGY